MLEQDNVIDGRARFHHSGANRVGDSFEDRLARTSRVPHSDRPTMANNLGRLAERIDPANPLAGAKRMVEATEHQGLWQKRKRFILLPTEQAPPVDSGETYGSSGLTYLQLARAAGRLLAANGSPDVVERERERAVRALAFGTSFLPNYTPLSKTEQTAKALIDEYATVLLTAVESRTRIADLWNVLRDSPIDLRSRSADDEPFELTFGGAERLPEILLSSIFRPHVVEAVFRPQDGYGCGWEHPSVALGFVALRFETNMFAVPPDVAKLFHASNVDEDYFCLGDEAIEWLCSIGGKRDIPDCEFDYSTGYGWKRVSLSLLRRVGLTLTQGDEGEPKLQLSIWGGSWDEPAVAFSPYGLRDHIEDRIVASGGEASQLRSVYIDQDQAMNVCVLYSDLVSMNPSADVEVVGLLPEWWTLDNEFHSLSEFGWSDHPQAASLLLGSVHRFIPTIPKCEPVAGPLRSGSLGAGLLNNAATALQSENVATSLIERAAITADAGLRFHEAMVDRYREALRRI